MKPGELGTFTQTHTMSANHIWSNRCTVREVVDKAIEHNDVIRRKKCMCYLKAPKRFPVPEDMENKETAAWTNWIHQETQALLDDLNEEIRLQNEADDPFTRDIVYAPTNIIQEAREVPTSQEPARRKKFSSENLPHTHEQHLEEKLMHFHCHWKEQAILYHNV